MKKSILILILGFAIGLNAQDQTILDFNKTKWFLNNSDYNFYKSDTIRLSKIKNLKSKNLKLNRTYLNLHRFNYKEVTEFIFKKNSKLIIQKFNVDKSTTSRIKGNWKYVFEPNSQILKFYFDSKLHSSFKFLSEENENMTWITENAHGSKKSKIELKKLNFIRIKNTIDDTMN